MSPPTQKITRRKLLIGITTLTFGASGFVASGAFTTGSGGSLGDNWVQVEGTDQTIEFSPQQLDPADDGSSGNGDANGGGDDETEPEEDEAVEAETEDEEVDEEVDDDEDEADDDPTDEDTGDGETGVETRVQVVTQPDNPGNAVNGSGSASWNGNLVDSDIILSTDEGFFRGLGVQNANRNAVSRLGSLTSGGYPGDRVAFLIANVGPESGDSGATVSITASLAGGGSSISTDQLRFPYRVVDSSGNSVSRGENLLTGSGVELRDGHLIELVVVVDTRGGFEEIERVDTLRFNASEVS